jgi:hypothetical protein
VYGSPIASYMRLHYASGGVLILINRRKFSLRHENGLDVYDVNRAEIDRHVFLPLALPASIAPDSAIYVDPYLWGCQAVQRVRRKLLGSEASTQQALDQSPEVRAGIVARDDPTKPCRSPYMPEVLVITR